MLVVASGLAVAAWGLHAGQKQSVVTVTATVAKGQVIERDDLASAAVAGVEGAIPIGDLPSVVGKTASVDLLQGQVLTSSAVTASPVPGPGQAVVGLSLDATRAPTFGLEPGDRVEVIAVPVAADGTAVGEGEAAGVDIDAPAVLASEALVYAVEANTTTGSQLQITLVVGSDEAAPLAAYSTQNRVALIETPSVGAAPEGTGAP